MANLPVFFEIGEIESYLRSIKNKKDKISYLIYLREEYIKICYHFTDDQIGKYLSNRKIEIKFEKLKYLLFGDAYQSHISRSEYILFLQEIDRKLLPFVRKSLYEFDKSIVEDSSKIIKDYKIFNFDVKKVLDYSNNLNQDKISYLEWMIFEYYHHQKKIFDTHPPVFSSNKKDNPNPEINIFSLPFIKKIRARVDLLKRYPDMMIINSYSEYEEEIMKRKRKILFANEKSLYEFNFTKIQKHSKNIKDINKRLLYLEYVNKVAEQYKELINDAEGSVSFIDKIKIEIQFVNNELSLNNKVVFSPNTFNKSHNFSNSIKLKWQKENVLLPYLFEVLFEQGFISDSDYANKHKFIEQSFLKKNGQPFSSKESVQTENNYKTNNKNDRKPRNAHKIQKAMDILNSKKIRNKK